MKHTETAKHTPGPWTLDTTWSLIMGPDGEEVAAIHAAEGVNGPRVNLGTAQANSALIAAAPELLEALKEFIAWHCGVSNDCGHDVCVNARAAIAKAEGRTS